MATIHQLKQDIVRVLDNIGHDVCRECLELTLPSCAHNNPEALRRSLRNVLTQWSRPGHNIGDEEIQPVYYHFEDWCCNDTLSAMKLGGADARKLEAVQSLVSELSFKVYLARLQRTDEGVTDQYDEDPYAMEEEEGDEDEDRDESEVGENVYLANNADQSVGNPQACQNRDGMVASDEEERETRWTVQILLTGDTTVELPLDPTNIAQGDLFFDLGDPDNEEIDDDCNDIRLGARQIREYRALAMAIIPESSTHHFFSQVFEKDQGDQSAQILHYFTSRCLMSSADIEDFQMLQTVCSVWTTWSGIRKQNLWVAVRESRLPRELTMDLLRVAMKYGNQELFDSVCDKLQHVHYLKEISEIVQSTTLCLDTFRLRLIQVITAIPTLEERYTAISTLNQGNVCNRLRRMADDALDESVRRCELELLTQQDGERLVSIARNERDFDWLCKIAIPIVQKKQECAAFVLGFIWNLYTSALQEVFPKEAALVIVRSTAESVARSFRVSQLVSMAYWLHESRKRATLHSKTGQSIVQILPSLPAPAKIATLTNFLTVMVELGMENELMILSDSLITQRQLMPEQELFNLYIPVLRDLFLMLEKLPGTSFTEPKYQKLFVGLIGEYWEKHKNARPQMHWGLKSRETKHGCRVCLTLDGFLLDKNKNKLTMSNHASTGNKAHLCKMLASLGDCLDYQDTGKQYHITKRTSDYQMDIKSWESCGSRIQSILRELNQYHLAKLLGRHYQSLVGVPPQACHADSSISIPQNLVTEQPGIPGYGSDVNQYAQHSTTQATQPTPSILNGPQNAPPVMFSAPRSMYRVSQRAETTCNASMVPCCPPDSGIRIPMTPNFQNQQPAANTKRKFDGQLTYPNKVNQATTNDHCMTNLEDVVDLTGED